MVTVENYKLEDFTLPFKIPVHLKVKVKVKQKDKFTELVITSRLIVTETLNLVYTLIYEKAHQIWPWPLLLTLTLKSLAKVKNLETSIKEI